MRYLPLTAKDRADMLAVIGAPGVDAFYEDVPMAARLGKQIGGLPDHKGELEVERILSRMAAKNTPAGSVPFFIGAGAYKHHVPATVDHIIQRSEFLTTYTPYQPEIAQGTLQSLFEFQTQVALLLGMDVANASMYDGSTACAEAALMTARVTRRKKVILSGGLHPHYAEVVRGQAEAVGIEIVQLPLAVDDEAGVLAHVDSDTAGVIVQTPNVFGTITDLTAIAAGVHAAGALLVSTFTECLAFGAVTPPGEMGADIVVGEGQSIGNGLNFGGPYVGLFAAREKYVRQMPGRLAGETVDATGKRGFVLTLSTREQHIRRDKATSNICTNSGLCALAWTAHMTLLGDQGLTRLAALNHQQAVKTADALAGVKGIEVLTGAFFNEFAIRVPVEARPLVQALADKGVMAGVSVSRLDPVAAKTAGMDDVILLAATETVTDGDIAALVQAFKEVL
jgi:glycine dehydrogenase subunit 1